MTIDKLGFPGGNIFLQKSGQCCAKCNTAKRTLEITVFHYCHGGIGIALDIIMISQNNGNSGCWGWFYRTGCTGRFRIDDRSCDENTCDNERKRHCQKRPGRRGNRRHWGYVVYRLYFVFHGIATLSRSKKNHNYRWRSGQRKTEMHAPIKPMSCTVVSFNPVKTRLKSTKSPAQKAKNWMNTPVIKLSAINTSKTPLRYMSCVALIPTLPTNAIIDAGMDVLIQNVG